MLFKNGERIVFAGDSITDAGRTYPIGEGSGLGQLDRGGDRSARGDAHEQALAFGEAAGGEIGFLLGNGEDLVADRSIKIPGNKVRADALQTVGGARTA